MAYFCNDKVESKGNEVASERNETIQQAIFHSTKKSKALL